VSKLEKMKTRRKNPNVEQVKSKEQLIYLLVSELLIAFTICWTVYFLPANLDKLTYIIEYLMSYLF
jgi:hypothetical protein